MSWMASLDTKSTTWPRAARWAYLGVKWFLIVLGAFALLNLYLQRLDPQYWRDMLG